MKRWQQVLFVFLSVFLLLLIVGITSANNGTYAPPILAITPSLTWLLTKLMTTGAVIADTVLDTWVSGYNLTDPAGETLVGALATIVENLAEFLAQFAQLP